MRRRLIVTFLAPALIIYLGLVILPSIQSIYLSLLETSGFADQSRWVGIANFVNLASDPIFWLSVAHMLLILVAGGIIIFALAFLFTMLMSSGIWGKKLFRALIFLPNVVSVVGLSTFWMFVFTPRYGLLTNLLKSVGLTALAQTSWTGPENVFWAMMVGMIWIFAGFFTLLILAGADKIPGELYEAARLDGASQAQMFRLITVPMISDVILITAILWVISAIKMMEFPYAFGGPNINQNLYTPAIYLFIEGFGQRQPVYQLGYASAIGVVMFVFTVLAVLLIGGIFRRERLEY